MKLNDLMTQDYKLISNGFCQEVRLYKSNIVLSIINVEELDSWDCDVDKIFYFIQNYVSKIKNCGINIPEVYVYEKDRNKIFQAKEFILGSFEEKVLSASIQEIEEQISQVLEIINKLDLTVGIDPTPKNFRIKDNKLYYVDFFYPYTSEYVTWKQSRIDLNTEKGKKYFYIPKMFFIPKVYLHLAKDFIKMRNDLEETILACINSNKTVEETFINFQNEYYTLIKSYEDI